MKNKRIFKTFSALCAALVLMMGLSVTAFAQGTEELPAEDATNDSNVVVEETEDSPALTPDGKYALWNGAATKDQSAINLFDFDGNLVKGYWHQPEQFNWMLLSVFYSYAGNTYFSTGYSPDVYELSADTLQAVYQWDFGENNLSPSVLRNIENEDEPHSDKLVGEYLENGTLPYSFDIQYQNERYYYVRLTKSYGNLLYDIFYDKQTGYSFVFDKVKEGFSISPLAMTDEYMLCLLKYEDFDLMKEVLPEDEYDKLTKLDEESNPCLLRLYFK